MANHTKLTPKRRQELLAILGQGFSVTKAARTVGVARTYLYEVRREDPAFAAEWDAAWEEGTETLEDEARRRAHDGVARAKGVYYQGMQVGTEVETVYSDTLLTLLLKARKPDTYRERTETTLKGDPTAPIEVVEFRRRERADGG